MSSTDSDMMISTGATTATNEVDIAISPTNICNIIAAANDANGGPQRIFYSPDCGVTWRLSTLPLSGDLYHRHPSVGWTSDQRAWVITKATTNLGETLRCYYSGDITVNPTPTWKIDQTFIIEPTTTIQSPRMWIERTEDFGFLDTIYVIWGTNNLVFVKSRHPQSGTWRPTTQLPSQSLQGNVNGCDIKADENGTVAAFWHEERTRKLLVSLSTSNDAQSGPIFGTPSTIASTIAYSSIAIPSCANNKAAISISSVARGGGLYVVWADLTGDSGCNTASEEPGTNVTSSCKTRIWFSKFDGVSPMWQTKMISDGTSLNDEFHPRLFQDLNTGTLVVVYYDTAFDPGRLKTDVWMRTSEDLGENWSSPIKLTTAQTDETTIGHQEYQYGDYLGITGQSGILFAAWTDRRSGLPEQIWARRFRIPTLLDPCSDPFLTGATITFNSTGNDKDPDTIVQIILSTVIDNEIVSYVADTFGYFDNPSSHQINLPLHRFSLPKSRVMRGHVKIIIEPNGNDEWIFNFTLDFTFSNGESIHLGPNRDITLDQDNKISDMIDIRSMKQT